MKNNYDELGEKVCGQGVPCVHLKVRVTELKVTPGSVSSVRKTARGISSQSTHNPTQPVPCRRHTRRITHKIWKGRRSQELAIFVTPPIVHITYPLYLAMGRIFFGVKVSLGHVPHNLFCMALKYSLRYHMFKSLLHVMQIV